MYKLWLILDPRRTLAAIMAFLILLGLLIHLLLLATVDLNWHEDGRPIPLKAAAAYERSQSGLPY
ncbi:light-harvesting antenna LH1, alpha subunit [Thiococcus pfennigii]|jgi:light-harvesting complex 1 alpha chain|uniref:light-harvesting antenna LH1, alpha subunit n=1 Tax=Thiococcus pfennigii TaxID=1057 RepID=UPI001907E5AA|nr:light-harvesting antenna LH1, alpha subunit [Thiococcus pfennigii]MBK1700662.1 light-harvesting protein [Thiococcus pfennigii]MBK1732814.1 light-harvesting protein [Thiococcus pfennigii]